MGYRELKALEKRLEKFQAWGAVPIAMGLFILVFCFLSLAAVFPLFGKIVMALAIGGSYVYFFIAYPKAGLATVILAVAAWVYWFFFW